jgi:hypothetical protein
MLPFLLVLGAIELEHHIIPQGRIIRARTLLDGVLHKTFVVFVDIIIRSSGLSQKTGHGVEIYVYGPKTQTTALVEPFIEFRELVDKKQSRLVYPLFLDFR